MGPVVGDEEFVEIEGWRGGAAEVQVLESATGCDDVGGAICCPRGGFGLIARGIHNGTDSFLGAVCIELDLGNAEVGGVGGDRRDERIADALYAQSESLLADAEADAVGGEGHR